MHIIHGGDGNDYDLDETKHVDNGSRETRRRSRTQGSEYTRENNISERAPLAYVMRAKCEFSRKIHHPPHDPSSGLCTVRRTVGVAHSDANQPFVAN